MENKMDNIKWNRMNNSKMENKMDNIKWTKMDKNKHKIK
jgi:hypothetical protein